MVGKKIECNDESSVAEDRNEYNNKYEEENDGGNIIPKTPTTYMIASSLKRDMSGQVTRQTMKRHGSLHGH